MVKLSSISETDPVYAFKQLKQRWLDGGRDRETALRLMFLAWHLPDSFQHSARLAISGETPFAFALFEEIFQGLGGERADDAEFLFVSGHMWQQRVCLDKALCTEWQALGVRCLKRAAKLRPLGPEPSEFDGRGAYGSYFKWFLKQ